MTGKVTPLKTEAVRKDLSETKHVIIKAPKFERATVKIKGTAAYIQNKFSNYQQTKMMERQKAGSKLAKTKRAKEPKDFEKVYEGSMHISEEGWHGIPAMAIKIAMVEACRLTEVDMIRAKMCIKVIADGLDRENGDALIRINGNPDIFIDRVRIGINQTDLAARAIFRKWDAKITIEWDAETFTASDVVNLLARAGWHVGIGAGRPLSKTSCGTGKGTWEVEQ